MNKKMIIIIFCSLANIIGIDRKDQKINEYNLDDFRYNIETILNTELSLSGIKININKYGMKFSALNRENMHTVLLISRDHNQLSAPSVYLGGKITFGDSTNPITISQNHNLASPIIWPIQSGVSLLGINSTGNLITTTSSISGNELGQDGYNQILCKQTSPITITSHAPANGDIILTVGTDTNGNIKLLGNTGEIYLNSNSIDTPATGNFLYLCINSNNQLMTLSPNPGPFFCTNLTATGIVSLGTYIPGTSSNITINNNVLKNNASSNGIVFNGNVYFNNTDFPLPGVNQTTTLIIDNNGKVGILLSSKKYKENITPLKITRDAFNKLKPASYNYKNAIESVAIKNVGLIAEEVYDIPELRDLVILDKNGKPLSVKYTELAVITADQIQQDRIINEINNIKNSDHIKELYILIEKLSQEIKELKNK